MRRRIVVAALTLAAALAACASAAERRAVGVTLDWTPNPNHVGLYVARDRGLFSQAGLDVTLRAPSDPTAPLKLVAAGRSDLAVSYEQEVFFAAAKRLPVVAVAAVVPRPLNSIIAIDRSVRGVAGLRGRSVGITGVPADYAALDTALAKAHLSRKDVKVVSVGYNLLPSLLSHRVDAVLGVYRNVEGIELQQRGEKPTVIPLNGAGVPTFDELVLVANSDRLRSDAGYRSTVTSFVRAFARGTSAAIARPADALAVMQKVTASDRRFLARAVPATLALLSTPRGPTCMSPAEWRRFGVWMQSRSLLKSRVLASTAMTTRYLPARCG
jgi:putative hydroxymethylpyrimidine transport system substrate-binding protein